MRPFLFFVFLLFFQNGFSQYLNLGYDFENRAATRYHLESYATVQNAWHIVPKYGYTLMDFEQEDYYKLSAALRQNVPGAEKKRLLFLSDYPQSELGNTIALDLAHYYFNNEKYSYALKWYRTLTLKNITKSKQPRYNFNYGYTLFLTKNYNKAKPYLERVKSHPKFESDAHYYLGHIAYQLDDYEGASSSFSQVSNRSRKTDLGYFQVDMNFKIGRFEEAIRLGKIQLEKADASNTSQLSKIIGESYFNLKQFEDALPFLQAYQGNSKGWEAVDYYQLGYVYYHIGDYNSATAQFNKIINSKTPLAQSAYYMLADCYLKSQKKIEALNAFRSAAQMSYDTDLQKDALLQYAKLSYQIGNPYEDTAEVLLRYIERYPDDSEIEALEKLLINSYTNGANYEAALALLTSKNNYRNAALLQKVAFLYGIEWYTSGNYTQAFEYLEQAASSNENKTIKARATYWMGVAAYELGRYSLAIESFLDFEKQGNKSTPEESKQFYYQLGYAYFQLQDYAQALAAFEKQLKHQKPLTATYQIDLYTRMGDAHFALKDYWPAMEQYNKVIALRPENSFYAYYQKSISYGFVDRNQQKISTLAALIEQTQKNPYLDDALYELANTYASTQDAKNALITYQKLIQNHPTSPYIPRALLNKGLVHYNLEQLDYAKNDLETVVLKFSRDLAAQQALTTLREIAIEEGSTAAFRQFVQTHQISSISEVELAQTAFLAAEKYYLDNRTKQAQKLLVDYIVTYPNNPNTLTAKFYLAELYYEQEDWSNALEVYREIGFLPINEYTEKVLVRAAIAATNTPEKEAAIPLWRRLDSIASFEENKRYAQFNLMKAAYETQIYEEAKTRSQQIITYPDLDPKIKWDAYDILAHSALKVGDSIQAQAAFLALENAPDDVRAAEALFFKATLQAQRGDFAGSNTTIASISQNHSNSGIWGAKSLLLMAQNFQATDDPFQAQFILDTLIENFTAYPEVQEAAQQLKAKITLATSQSENQNYTPDEN